MTDPEVEEIMKACAGPEDEEGFIKYESEFDCEINPIFGKIV